MNPKHNPIKWKSAVYRDWIHKNKACYCGRPLHMQDGWLHHHLNTGGKKPQDYMLTRWCAVCHSEIHYSAASKEKLYKTHNLTDEYIMIDNCRMLCEFLAEDNSDEVMNKLAELVNEICN